MRMGMRKWLGESTYRLNLREAILFLAFHESLDSLPGLQRTNSAVAGDIEANYSSVARFALNSCWASVVVTLFSGVSIRGYANSTLVYPFKYLVLYAKHIKRFSEVISNVEPEMIDGKDLPGILSKITKEVERELGSNRINADYSATKTTGILKGLTAYDTHFKRIEKAEKLPADGKTKATSEKKGEGSVGEDKRPPGAEQSASSEKPETSADVPATESDIPFPCTCLRGAKVQLKLLSQMIQEHLSPIVSLRESLLSNSKLTIHFRDLWLLFQPGELVVSAKSPVQAYRVIHVSGGRPLMTNAITEKSDSESHTKYESVEHKGFRQKSKISPFAIDCIRYDFDGERFGPVQQNISIEEYEGERPITMLAVWPLRFSEDPKSLRQALVQRGRRFSEFQTFQHRRYEGLSLDEPQEEVSSPHPAVFDLGLMVPLDRKRSHRGFRACI